MASADYVVVWPKAKVRVGDSTKVLSRGDKLPRKVTDEHAALLASFGAIATVTKVEAKAAPAPAPDDGPFDPAGATIEKVLEHVGSDQAKAEQVLELEKARGDNARSTLVTQLEELAAPQS